LIALQLIKTNLAEITKNIRYNMIQEYYNYGIL